MITIKPHPSHLQYDWQADIRNWPGFGKVHRDDLADDVISLFQHAFQYTRCSNLAWFGVHDSIVSLVVGGIFLAAIVRSGEDRGIWLLLDQPQDSLDGLKCHSVKSTQSAEFPLIWGHASSMTVISELVTNASIWESFARASEKILLAKRVASDRDSVQIRRGKRRLDEFWPSDVVNLFPDEISGDVTFLEGAKRQVTVNAYERNQRARQVCIQHYGACCFICGFSFGSFYGEVAKNFIHVHHLRPFSEINEAYEVDPLVDLRPVCPNCHAVLHLRRPAFSVEEIIDFVRQNRPQ